MEELYCFTSNLYFNHEYSTHGKSYKLEANYLPLKAIAIEILRFISGDEVTPFNCDNFKIELYKYKSQKDFILSIEPHPNNNKALLFNISTELRQSWENKIWKRWEPIIKLIQKHEDLGYVFIEEDNIENSDFRIDINEKTLSKSSFLMNLGINNFSKAYPDIKPYHIELWFYYLKLSVSAESDSFDEVQLISILEQCINLHGHISKYKGSLELFKDLQILSQEIESAYLKSSFDNLESEVLSYNREFCFHSHNFGELHVIYELGTVSITLPYYSNGDDPYVLKTFKIESISNIQSLLLYLNKIGYFATNSEIYAYFNSLILTLHIRLTNEIWPEDKLVRKDILKSYYQTIPKQQIEHWIKGILDKDIRDILNSILKDAKFKKEDYNYICSSTSEILYDGNEFLIKSDSSSEQWDVLNIAAIKTSLDLYDLVYLNLMSNLGINLSRFLLIQIIERVSANNKLSSYDLLTEYDAIVNVRSNTEKHQAIIKKWENDNIDDDYEEDSRNGFYSNEFLRKSYNEYFGQPDADGWVDTNDY